MAPSRPELAELLQPTLDESADPRHMRAAWSPWQLAPFAALGGPLAAGYLYGENFRRLGRGALQAWCVIGALLLLVVAGLATGRLRALGYLEHGKGMERFVAQGLTVLAVLPLAAAQQARYRIFTGSGGEPGTLRTQGLCAVLVGAFFGNALLVWVSSWSG